MSRTARWPIEQPIASNAESAAATAADTGRTQLRAKDLALLCFFVIISDLSFSGLTALVVDYERVLHFDLVTTGWVATAEGAGYTFGAFLSVLLTGHVSVTRRRVAAIFAILGVAQFCSLLTTDPWCFAAIRSLSGIAAGLAYAAGIFTISMSHNSERGFAIYFGGNFASGLVALILIPPVVAAAGLHGFYVLYGVSLLACIFLARWFPLAATPAASRPEFRVASEAPRSRRGTWPLVIALFVNFVFNGGVWVLAEHFGLEIPGTSTGSLSPLLAGTMAFGLLGTLLTTLGSGRIGHMTFITLGNIGLIAAVGVLTVWHSLVGLIVAMALLNISVTCLTPAALAALAVKGPRGAQLGNLACQSGYSLGAAVVASIGARTGLDGLVWISAAAFALSAVLAWAGITAVDRRES